MQQVSVNIFRPYNINKLQRSSYGDSVRQNATAVLS